MKTERETLQKERQALDELNQHIADLKRRRREQVEVILAAESRIEEAEKARQKALEESVAAGQDTKELAEATKAKKAADEELQEAKERLAALDRVIVDKCDESEAQQQRAENAHRQYWRAVEQHHLKKAANAAPHLIAAYWASQAAGRMPREFTEYLSATNDKSGALAAIGIDKWTLEAAESPDPDVPMREPTTPHMQNRSWSDGSGERTDLSTKAMLAGDDRAAS
jgi:hypothetical protein